MGEFHGPFHIIFRTRIRSALIKGHDDIGPDASLHIHSTFRGKEVLRTIDMGTKSNPFLPKLPFSGQRINLISPAVRQDRPLPSHEAMQSPRILEDLHTRPQEEMIGIAEDDRGLGILFQIPLVDRLNSPSSANGHEDRGGRSPMRRVQTPLTGLAFLILRLDPELHRRPKIGRGSVPISQIGPFRSLPCSTFS